MPITPAYEWQESAAWVTINVKIPNVTRNSTDIMTTECYVKVNSAPYFFEADLQGEVDNEKSQACVDQNVIKFFLIKREPRLWERLTMAGDRKLRLDRRERSLQAVRAHREKVRNEYPAKFSSIGRLAVGEHMKLEEMKRKVIKERKEAERLFEQENINRWKNYDLNGRPSRTDNQNIRTYHDAQPGMRFVQDGSPDGISTSSSKAAGGAERSITGDAGTSEKIRRTAAHDSSVVHPKAETIHARGCDIDGSSSGRTYTSGCHDQARPNGFAEISDIPQVPQGQTRLAPAGTSDSNGDTGAVRYSGVTMPAPRRCSTVCVTFSPKPDLPQHLPARESRERDIKLHKSGTMQEDTLDVSERAPLFLQDKGDKFFRAGDYQSAINAYTDALAKDSSLVVSLANRAACKLHLKDYQACVKDCSAALAILNEPNCTTKYKVQENEPSLVPQTLSAAADGEMMRTAQGAKLLGTNGELSEGSFTPEITLLAEDPQVSDDTKAPELENHHTLPGKIPVTSHDLCTFDTNFAATYHKEEKILSISSPEIEESSQRTGVPQPPAHHYKLQKGDHDDLPGTRDDPSSDHHRRSCTAASSNVAEEIRRGKYEASQKTPEVTEMQGQDPDKNTCQQNAVSLARVSDYPGHQSANIEADVDPQPTQQKEEGDVYLQIDNFFVERLELTRCLSGEGCCCTRGLKIEGAGVAEWKANMRKHMLVRRAVAKCHLGDPLKAVDDFRKVLLSDPANQGVRDALAVIRTNLPGSGPR